MVQFIIFKVHIKSFLIFKVHEKIDLSSIWFLISGWFWFLRWFVFKTTVPKVFWVKKELKMNFWVEKLKPWFVGHLSSRNLGKSDNATTVEVFRPRLKKGPSCMGLPRQTRAWALMRWVKWPFFILFSLFFFLPKILWQRSPAIRPCVFVKLQCTLHHIRWFLQCFCEKWI